MSDDVEYRERLSTRVRFGFALLGGADRLDLDDASFVNDSGGVTHVLLSSPRHPHGEAFVAVRMYRFPRRRIGFDSDCDRFCKSKKERCRLPDRTAVTDDTLALLHPPAGWSHDARPQSGRRLFHVYRGRTGGVIFQVVLGTGAGPDHPLVLAVRENLRVDADRWIVAKPSVRGVAVPRVVPESAVEPPKAPARRKRREPAATTRAAGRADREAHAAGAARPWRGRWPKGGSVRDWMIAQIRAAEGIADPKESATHGQWGIETLGRIGETETALRYADGYLRRLPQSLPSSRLWMAKAAADICLAAGDRERMEKYLAVAVATDPCFTKKPDVGYAVRSVRDFRARKGILDPADAVDDDQRALAGIRQAGRAFREALARGDRQGARAAIGTMSKIARGVRDEWFRTCYLREVIEACAALEDVAEVRRHLRLLDPDDRHEAIDPMVLLRLGMEKDALPSIRAAMRRNLEAAADVRDFDTHHHVYSFVKNIGRLVELGARDEARRWLGRALGARGQWATSGIGCFSAGVAGDLAEAAHTLGEVAIARRLLGVAMGEALSESRKGWRHAAISSCLLSPANAGMLESAIDEAKRIRSPRTRRETLACLLARVERWGELHELLDSIESAEEAAEVVWRLHFHLTETQQRGLHR